jgi:hypothetical protein
LPRNQPPIPSPTSPTSWSSIARALRRAERSSAPRCALTDPCRERKLHGSQLPAESRSAWCAATSGRSGKPSLSRRPSTDQQLPERGRWPGSWAWWVERGGVRVGVGRESGERLPPPFHPWRKNRTMEALSRVRPLRIRQYPEPRSRPKSYRPASRASSGLPSRSWSTRWPRAGATARPSSWPSGW